MEKKYYLLFLLFFLFSKAFCQAPDSFSITFENDNWKKNITFDTTGDTNIWTIGKPKGIVFNKAWEGENAIFTDKTLINKNNNNSSFIVTVPINKFVAHYGNIGFYLRANLSKNDTFNIYFNTDKSDSVSLLQKKYQLSWEYRIIKFGETKKMGIPPFTDTFNSWIYAEFSFNNLSKIISDTFQLLFSYITKSSDDYEGIMIDSLFSSFHIISVNEVPPTTNYQIYPNPCNGILHIEAQKQGNVTIELIDIYSRIVRKTSCFLTKKYLLNLKGITPGIYLVKILSEDNQVFMAKVIMQ